MHSSNPRWIPVIAVICASSVCLTGCKSFSWSKLPGMSYFASDDKPQQSYYGNQEAPADSYNASTVDYSQRYGNSATANTSNTYGQQYDSTNVGNSNYLTNQPRQQALGQSQQQFYGQPQGGNQTATYPAQTQQQQQYQPQGQNFNVATQNQTNGFTPQSQQGLITTPNTPTAGTLQDTTANYNGGGFYNPNANVGSYQPATTVENTPNVPTYSTTGMEQTQGGAAAYIAETPANSQFDGGNYQPAGGNFQPTGNTTAPMPAYRPGSTGGTNGYYTPTGSNFNGQ